MYDIYNWPTSNGRKINIAVEELEVDYKIHPIAIGKGQQFTNEFTALNPNQKIPAVVDQDGPGGKPYPMPGPGKGGRAPGGPINTIQPAPGAGLPGQNVGGGRRPIYDPSKNV